MSHLILFPLVLLPNIFLLCTSTPGVSGPATLDIMSDYHDCYSDAERSKFIEGVLATPHCVEQLNRFNHDKTSHMSPSHILDFHYSPNIYFGGITDQNGIFEIGGYCINLYRDWLVNLTERNGPLDISKKAFIMNFDEAPTMGSNFTIIFEQLASENDNTKKYTLYSAQVPILETRRLTTCQSPKRIIIIPSEYFPNADLSKGNRLVIQAPEKSRLITGVQMIDAPSEEIKHRFLHYYTQFIQALIEEQKQSSLFYVHVHAHNVYEEAFNVVMSAQINKLRSKLRVFSLDPESNGTKEMVSDPWLIDYADNQAKLMTLLSRAIVCPSRGLFVKSKDDDSLYEIASYLNGPMRYMSALTHFRFIGRVIGMAIVHRTPLDISFSREILRAILSGPEQEYSKSKFKGQTLHVEAQTVALCEGVYEVIPLESLIQFDVVELGWMISGRTDWNVCDLKEWTSNNARSETKVMKWFWEYVAGLSEKDLRTLLEIITDNPRLPSIGFPGYLSKFEITARNVKTFQNPDDYEPLRVNLSGLCHLYIPHYSSKKILENQFNRAIGRKRHAVFDQ